MVFSRRNIGILIAVCTVAGAGIAVYEVRRRRKTRGSLATNPALANSPGELDGLDALENGVRGDDDDLKQTSVDADHAPRGGFEQGLAGSDGCAVRGQEFAYRSNDTTASAQKEGPRPVSRQIADELVDIPLSANDTEKEQVRQPVGTAAKQDVGELPSMRIPGASEASNEVTSSAPDQHQRKDPPAFRSDDMDQRHFGSKKQPDGSLAPKEDESLQRGVQQSDEEATSFNAALERAPRAGVVEDSAVRAAPAPSSNRPTRSENPSGPAADSVADIRSRLEEKSLQGGVVELPVTEKPKVSTRTNGHPVVGAAFEGVGDTRDRFDGQAQQTSLGSATPPDTKRRLSAGAPDVSSQGGVNDLRNQLEERAPTGFITIPEEASINSGGERRNAQGPDVTGLERMGAVRNEFEELALQGGPYTGNDVGERMASSTRGSSEQGPDVASFENVDVIQKRLEHQTPQANVRDQTNMEEPTVSSVRQESDEQKGPDVASFENVDVIRKRLEHQTPQANVRDQTNMEMPTVSSVRQESDEQKGPDVASFENVDVIRKRLVHQTPQANVRDQTNMEEPTVSSIQQDSDGQKGPEVASSETVDVIRSKFDQPQDSVDEHKYVEEPTASSGTLRANNQAPVENSLPSVSVTRDRLEKEEPFRGLGVSPVLGNKTGVSSGPRENAQSPDVAALVDVDLLRNQLEPSLSQGDEHEEQNDGTAVPSEFLDQRSNAERANAAARLRLNSQTPEYSSFESPQVVRSRFEQRASEEIPAEQGKAGQAKVDFDAARRQWMQREGDKR